jgi:uncharacterized LabA/DUF88 family protein
LSKNVAVFVDVANLYYSARGQEVDVDYVALLKAATKGRDLIRAYAYSGLDPENENQRKFIDFLGKNGYKVITKDIRKFGDGRVKANLDIELVVDLFRLSSRMDIAVVVSGDGDFAPAIRALQDEGVRCEVISFRPNTSSDLIAVADEFIDIMKVIGIGRGKKEGEKVTRGMSAPPMPAKEVVPEFGFREASPGVAAAALAALREGKEPASGGRGRGRGRSRAADATIPPAAEAAPIVTASEEAPAAGDAEPRRRRRRRGGRGRGRGRGGAEAASRAQPEPADTPEGTEIGWVELDDISQLTDLEEDGFGEEREYSFEEADADTLAELGLPSAQVAEPAEAATREDAPAEAAEATPARRGRAKGAASTRAKSAKPKTEAAGTATGARRRAAPKPKPEATDAEAPARKSRSRAKPAAEAAAKPRARTSRASRTKADAADEAAPGASGADADAAQGIWQRFRGGRTKRS